MSPDKKRKPWVAPLAVLGIFAAVMAILSAFTLSSWGDLETVDADQAEGAFSRALERLGEEPAYIEVSPEDEVLVRRELEHAEPTDLASLNVLAYRPSTSRLLDMAFPFWFVRLKMSRALNLGTLASLLAGDWENLDLQVDTDELKLHGPGLVLDLTRPDGSRLMLWTE